MMEERDLHPIVKLAKDTVEMFVKDRETPRPRMEVPEMKERAGVFVSIHKHGQLRGCIGTFEPTQPNKVDILTRPEPVKSEAELDPVKYGVLVTSGPKKGILLPDLPGVNSVAQQIDIARSKAGISPDEPSRLFRFEVRRYE